MTSVTTDPTDANGTGPSGVRNLPSVLGARVRLLRRRRGDSQVSVARKAGITQASLSNYETGKRDMPVTTLLSIASALEVGLDELLQIPIVIVVKDSRLGRAVQRLSESPDLLDGFQRSAPSTEAAT